jgi:hypothetical protein
VSNKHPLPRGKESTIAAQSIETLVRILLHIFLKLSDEQRQLFGILPTQPLSY